MDRVKAVCLGLLAVLLVGGTTVWAVRPRPAAAPAQWTQFRLHQNNNAVIPGTLVASWHIPTGAPFSASPTLIGGVLYVGNNAGALYAVDAASGRVVWTFRVSNPIMSAPITFGDLLIVGEGNENSPTGSSPSHPIHVGSGEGALIAIDCATGKERWRITLSGSGMPTAAVIDGIVVHHDGAGNVLGIDGSTGRTLYRRKLGSIASMVAALPIGDDRFVTSGVQNNAVWQLHAHDGSVVWKSVFPATASGLGDCPPATDGQRVFCDYIMPSAPGKLALTEWPANQRLFALDAATGKVLWDRLLDHGILPKRNEASIPLVVGNTLFVGGSLGPWMHAFDPRTGDLIWHTQVRGPVKGGIVLVDGTIYFGDLSGYLWALDARDGAIVGDKNMGTPFNVGSPIVDGKTLFVGSAGGSILAVPLADIRSAHDD